MSHSDAAYRYAKSLSLIADETNEWNEIAREVALIDDFFKAEKDIFQFFLSPIVARERKVVSLETAIKGLNLRPISASFLKLLDQNKRISIVSDIRRCFDKMKDQRENIERVTVSFASKINSDQEESFVRSLKASLDKEVIATFEQDRRLLGGVRIQVGGKTIENSVAGRFKQIKKRILDR